PGSDFRRWVWITIAPFVTIDATMCAIIAWFIRDLLDFAGLSSNLAYITSVFIGYIGTDSIGSLIKRFAAKKAGVEDGGNQ
ncbi:phage holin, lambda family, partial [Escherichia coli]|uniref:phage holin, lambda family n=1 Tax=Escherichia coli TaxID=562 RepID=UPI000B7DBB8B